jgi:hypothetical protein
MAAVDRERRLDRRPAMVPLLARWIGQLTFHAVRFVALHNRETGLARLDHRHDAHTDGWGPVSTEDRSITRSGVECRTNEPCSPSIFPRRDVSEFCLKGGPELGLELSLHFFSPPSDDGWASPARP